MGQGGGWRGGEGGGGDNWWPAWTEKSLKAAETNQQGLCKIGPKCTRMAQNARGIQKKTKIGQKKVQHTGTIGKQSPAQSLWGGMHQIHGHKTMDQKLQAVQTLTKGHHQEWFAALPAESYPASAVRSVHIPASAHFFQRGIQ